MIRGLFVLGLFVSMIYQPLYVNNSNNAKSILLEEQ